MDTPLNVTREIRSRHAVFAEQLRLSVQFAALGERFALLPATLQLPDYPRVIVFGHSAKLEGSVRHHFAAHAVRHSLVALTASLDAHLESLNALRRTVELDVGNVQKAAASFTSLASPSDRRAEMLRRIISGERSEELVEAIRWIESLVPLQRCIVRGVPTVVASDLAPGESALKLTWRHSSISLDGDQAESLAHALSGSHVLGVRFMEQTRSYAIGQPIALHASDCDDLAISLCCLSLSLCQQLHRELALILA